MQLFPRTIAALIASTLLAATTRAAPAAPEDRFPALPDADLAVYVMVDVSLSMGGFGASDKEKLRWSGIRTLFLKVALGGRWCCALGVFNHNASHELDFTRLSEENRQDIAGRIETLSQTWDSGQTSIDRAMDTALRKLGELGSFRGQRAIILITDCDKAEDFKQSDEWTRQAKAANVQVHVIYLNTQNSERPRMQAMRQKLERIALEALDDRRSGDELSVPGEYATGKKLTTIERSVAELGSGTSGWMWPVYEEGQFTPTFDMIGQWLTRTSGCGGPSVYIQTDANGEAVLPAGTYRVIATVPEGSGVAIRNRVNQDVLVVAPVRPASPLQSGNGLSAATYPFGTNKQEGLTVEVTHQDVDALTANPDSNQMGAIKLRAPDGRPLARKWVTVFGYVRLRPLRTEEYEKLHSLVPADYYQDRTEPLAQISKAPQFQIMIRPYVLEFLPSLTNSQIEGIIDQVRDGRLPIMCLSPKGSRLIGVETRRDPLVSEALGGGTLALLSIVFQTRPPEPEYEEYMLQSPDGAPVLKSERASVRTEITPPLIQLVVRRTDVYGRTAVVWNSEQLVGSETASVAASPGDRLTYEVMLRALAGRPLPELPTGTQVNVTLQIRVKTDDPETSGIVSDSRPEDVVFTHSRNAVGLLWTGMLELGRKQIGDTVHEIRFHFAPAAPSGLGDNWLLVPVTVTSAPPPQWLRSNLYLADDEFPRNQAGMPILPSGRPFTIRGELTYEGSRPPFWTFDKTKPPPAALEVGPPNPANILEIESQPRPMANGVAYEFVLPGNLPPGIVTCRARYDASLGTHIAAVPPSVLELKAYILPPPGLAVAVAWTDDTVPLSPTEKDLSLLPAGTAIDVIGRSGQLPDAAGRYGYLRVVAPDGSAAASAVIAEDGTASLTGIALARPGNYQVVVQDSAGQAVQSGWFRVAEGLRYEVTPAQGWTEADGWVVPLLALPDGGLAPVVLDVRPAGGTLGQRQSAPPPWRREEELSLAGPTLGDAGGAKVTTLADGGWRVTFPPPPATGSAPAGRYPCNLLGTGTALLARGCLLVIRPEFHAGLDGTDQGRATASLVLHSSAPHAGALHVQCTMPEGTGPADGTLAATLEKYSFGAEDGNLQDHRDMERVSDIGWRTGLLQFPEEQTYRCHLHLRVSWFSRTPVDCRLEGNYVLVVRIKTTADPLVIHFTPHTGTLGPELQQFHYIPVRATATIVGALPKRRKDIAEALARGAGPALEVTYLGPSGQAELVGLMARNGLMPTRLALVSQSSAETQETLEFGAEFPAWLAGTYRCQANLSVGSGALGTTEALRAITESWTSEKTVLPAPAPLEIQLLCSLEDPEPREIAHLKLPAIAPLTAWDCYFLQARGSAIREPTTISFRPLLPSGPESGAVVERKPDKDGLVRLEHFSGDYLACYETIDSAGQRLTFGHRLRIDPPPPPPPLPKPLLVPRGMKFSILWPCPLGQGAPDYAKTYSFSASEPAGPDGSRPAKTSVVGNRLDVEASVWAWWESDGNPASATSTGGQEVQLARRRKDAQSKECPVHLEGYGVSVRTWEAVRYEIRVDGKTLAPEETCEPPYSIPRWQVPYMKTLRIGVEALSTENGKRSLSNMRLDSFSLGPAGGTAVCSLPFADGGRSVEINQRAPDRWEGDDEFRFGGSAFWPLSTKERRLLRLRVQIDPAASPDDASQGQSGAQAGARKVMHGSPELELLLIMETTFPWWVWLIRLLALLAIFSAWRLLWSLFLFRGIELGGEGNQFGDKGNKTLAGQSIADRRWLANLLCLDGWSSVIRRVVPQRFIRLVCDGFIRGISVLDLVSEDQLTKARDLIREVLGAMEGKPEDIDNALRLLGGRCKTLLPDVELGLRELAGKLGGGHGKPPSATPDPTEGETGGATEQRGPAAPSDARKSDKEWSDEAMRLLTSPVLEVSGTIRLRAWRPIRVHRVRRHGGIGDVTVAVKQPVPGSLKKEATAVGGEWLEIASPEPERDVDLVLSWRQGAEEKKYPVSLSGRTAGRAWGRGIWAHIRTTLLRRRKEGGEEAVSQREETRVGRRTKRPAPGRARRRTRPTTREFE